MIIRLAFAGLLGSLLATSALAQSTAPTDKPAAPSQTAPNQTEPARSGSPAMPPAPSSAVQAGTQTETQASAVDNAEACLKAASDLAQTAEDKKIAEDKLDKVDDLLTKMESHCDARQFVEAMAVAKDIKGIIEQ